MSTSTARHRWTLALSRRLEITGRLRMTSALHVGGGVGTSSTTDAGVLRHPDGRPFVPGSSMKGVLRSHLERLSRSAAFASVGVISCGLFDEEHDTDCPTPGWIDDRKDATKATESDFEKLCHTCTLFGSPLLAGKVRIPDLEVDTASYAGQVEIRDGVGIDRDSGKAVDGVKFDYEVVPVDTIFDFEIAVDSPDETETALVACAIAELMNGNVRIGGKTTRGLGSCVLEDVQVADQRFDDAASVASYLKGRLGVKTNGQKTDADQWVAAQIDSLLTK